MDSSDFSFAALCSDAKYLKVCIFAMASIKYDADYSDADVIALWPGGVFFFGSMESCFFSD